jgi:hypothetical protein
MQSVTIDINRRCPLSCAHCVVGFSPAYTGTPWRIDPAVLVGMIERLEPSLCGTVLLSGGEPTMDREVIREAARVCAEVGAEVGIVSAPVWASTAESARRLFDAVGRLDALVLSYDQYHLEYLAYRNYEHAVREAVARGTAVVALICYSTEQERQSLEDSLHSLRPLLKGVTSMRVFPHGNATRPGVIQDDDAIVLNDVGDLDRVPRSCTLGAAVVDSRQRVHGCRWSVIAERSPFVREMRSSALDEALRDLEQDPRFRAMRTPGFLDALTAEGRDHALARLKGQAVTQECEVCVRMMSDDAARLWEDGLVQEPPR